MTQQTHCEAGRIPRCLHQRARCSPKLAATGAIKRSHRSTHCGFASLSITALGIAQPLRLTRSHSARSRPWAQGLFGVFLERIDGNDLVWKDGTRQRIVPRQGGQAPSRRCSTTRHQGTCSPDVSPPGDKGPRTRGEFGSGPGSGTCRVPQDVRRRQEVQSRRRRRRTWSGPGKKYGRTQSSSRRSTAPRRAGQKVSDELDGCRNKFLEYLRAAGKAKATMSPIAGTNRLSARWIGDCDRYRRGAFARKNTGCGQKPDASGRVHYKNEIPWERFVRRFEAHGSCGAASRYHYDTMHFRSTGGPEILMNARIERPTVADSDPNRRTAAASAADHA